MKSNHNRTDCLNSAAGRCRREKGFTLIEVMIALTIFAVGMLAVATMQISAISVNARAKRLTQRTTYAQDKIEELIALDYTDTALDSAIPHSETHTDGFTVSWTITNNNPIPNLKSIVVTVTGYGGQRTVISHAKADL
ncbi:prepilin-type N-terminal cleavage/methylation domain-containing protein [Thermodesulfobacteriota bacterium]